MQEDVRAPWSRWFGPPASCALAWALAAMIARARGFSCVSDDDFARVTIAQQFAVLPRLDPSQTSWLPLPFWVTGLAMMALGRSLEVARAVATAQAAASGALLYAAGRSVGLGRTSAVAGAMLPLAVPLDRLLAAATVPEIPTAALVAYAVLAARSSPVSAAVCALAASLSRYEAWPAAAAVAVIVALGPHRRRERVLGVVLAAIGPVAWAVWNGVEHGDPLRFARRVAAYQAGLGVATDALAYVAAVLREGGAVVALAVIAVLALGREGARRFGPALATAALLVLAPTLAALGGGAPTHHPERAVIAVWILAGIVAAGAGPEAALLSLRVRPLAVVVLGAASIVVHGVLRAGATWSSLGPSREDEIALGRAVAREVPPGERFLIVPGSFAYLATVAASGRPEDARAIVRRTIDPRSTVTRDPLASRADLDAAASREGARWVVATGPEAASLAALGVDVIPLPGGVLARVPSGR